MKKTVLAIIIVAILATALFSCGKGGESNDDPNVIKLTTIENISDYVIVRSDASSAAATAAASKLRKAINEATGASVAPKTDFSTGTYEILVGQTTRTESIEAHEGLRFHDYVIKKVGNKIVIAAGSDDALEAACEFFKANFINAEAKTVKVPIGNGYSYKGTYLIDSFTVDGVDISEFSVYYDGSILLNDDGDIDAIEKMREDFGAELKLVQKNKLDDAHYIIIDNTGLIEHEYSIEVKDGDIYINGSFNTIDDALAYFVGDYLGGKKEIALKSGESSSGIMSTGKKEIYTKEQLMQVMTDVYNDSNACIIGQQTEGGKAMVSDTVADFLEATGDKPGIIGIDLAVYGVQLPYLSAEKWSQLVCEITDYCAEGGIITASAHWANPYDPSQYVRGDLGDYDTVEEYEAAFRAVITPGNEYYDFFMEELALNGDFLQALEDNDVTMVWRPLHEMNGSWFWYCVVQDGKTMSADTLIEMWQFVYEYLEDERGLDNLIWCYGPNYSANVQNVPGGTMGPMYCYPGDEYVDMVGVDWYTGGNLEVMQNDNYIGMVEETGKIGALTEFGPGGSVRADTIEDQPNFYNTDDLLLDLWTMLEEGYNFTYLLTWTPGSRASIGALGGDSGAKEFMREDYTLGLNEVKAMFDALK